MYIPKYLNKGCSRSIWTSSFMLIDAAIPDVSAMSIAGAKKKVALSRAIIPFNTTSYSKL